MEKRTDHSRELVGSAGYNGLYNNELDTSYGRFDISTEYTHSNWFTYGQYVSQPTGYTRSNQTQLDYIAGIIHKEQALQAEEYNQSNPLFLLPQEMLNQIFSSCPTPAQAQSLEKTIKTFMKLSATCKSFNKLLTFETIGNFCTNYAQNDKDQTLQNITQYMNNYTYKAKRLPALIVSCAGATLKPKHELDPLFEIAIIKPKGDLDFLFEIAIRHADAQLLKALFKNHALVDLGRSFFDAKTIEMVQIFIDNKVNLHVTDNYSKTNVLWYILEDQYPSAIMELYLKHHVDAKKLRSDNSCVLHKLAKPSSICKINKVDNFLKKAILLLNAIPDMINTLNDYDETPVDAVKAFLQEAKSNGLLPEAFEKLLTLFRIRGGLTAQELTQQNTSPQQIVENDKECTCIICLEPQETMFDVPCANGHPEERICVECYNQLLTTSDKCPICRNVLMQ